MKLDGNGEIDIFIEKMKSIRTKEAELIYSNNTVGIIRINLHADLFLLPCKK